MKILTVVVGKLGLPVSDLVAEILRILEPAVRTRIIVRYARNSSEFSDGLATVATVFDESQEIDAVAARAGAEVVPEIVIHAERGCVGSSVSERRKTAIPALSTG